MSEQIRILLVDDEKAFLKITKKQLVDHGGFEVEPEQDPTEVLDRVESEDFDCIVCDYQMPGMDGLDVFQLVRESGHEMPFFLYTGEGDESVASAALDLGVTDYIRKSNDPEQFTVMANRIERAVEGHQSLVAGEDHDEILESLVEDGPDGVLICDQNEILHINNDFVDLCDASRKLEINGKSPEELVEVDASLELDSAYSPDANEWHSGTLTRVDGAEVDVEVSPCPIPYDRRECVRYAVREV